MRKLLVVLVGLIMVSCQKDNIKPNGGTSASNQPIYSSTHKLSWETSGSDIEGITLNGTGIDATSNNITVMKGDKIIIRLFCLTGSGYIKLFLDNTQIKTGSCEIQYTLTE